MERIGLELAYDLFLAVIRTSSLKRSLVVNTGLRDSDNLWFDGMHGCQVTDKVPTYPYPVLKGGLLTCDALRRNGHTTKVLSHQV